MRPELQERIDAAVAAGVAADTARFAGDLDRAAARDREAEALLAALVADDPGEPAHVRALGARCYVAGETFLMRAEPATAIDVLDRAEAAYRSLAGTGVAGPADVGEVAAWIADVRARRARGLVALDRPASAAVDSQAAALTHLRRWDGDSDHGRALDTARVLAWHAWVTSRVGDPDLAVGAADTAVRIYIHRAAEVNTAPELRALHLPLFLLAARVAAVVHDAYGRADLAAAAAEMGSLEGPGVVAWSDLPTVPGIRAALTLAEALDRAGSGADAGDLRDLRDQLTAPAVDCRLLVPADRCAADIAPVRAAQLGQLADRVADDLPALLRLSLEAHALFAHASEAGVPAMRYDIGRWGPVWAEVARRASQACHAAGRSAAAVDLARWMVGAVEALGPHVVVDGAARATARRCLTWHGQLSAATGDEPAARAALDALDALAALPPDTPA